MNRICGSLVAAGYHVLLVGYKRKNSVELQKKQFSQKRINCLFKTGKLFYAEYNLRLFFYLLFKKHDCICAIDLDTILPCYFVSKFKTVKRVYDAHEYFTQLKEVISRPFIYKYWHWVERAMIPRFKNGYTVCKSITDIFNKKYGVEYEVIRNMPLLSPLPEIEKKENILLYQGSINKGRGLDKLVAAMQNIKGVLWICGDGNFIDEMKAAIKKYNVSEKIIFWGMLNPVDLKMKTATATVAINPFEKEGLNQYLSLSNKFFDYIHSALPQVTMNYPEYSNINREIEVALLINDLEPDTIATAVNKLFSDKELYNRLKNNCDKAREKFNWQQEENKLLSFYQQLFNE
jgi:glycosyltransferase involved in cell wall biosynthesis